MTDNFYNTRFAIIGAAGYVGPRHMRAINELGGGLVAALDPSDSVGVIEKLNIFPGEIEQRVSVAKRYNAALSDTSVITPPLDNGITSVWAQYTVRLPSVNRNEVATVLARQGIPTNVYYPKSLNRQPAYARYQAIAGEVPISERLPGEVLSRGRLIPR